ncbi:unnamed protein product [Scytosiphon promiscuus]
MHASAVGRRDLGTRNQLSRKHQRVPAQHRQQTRQDRNRRPLRAEEEMCLVRETARKDPRGEDFKVNNPAGNHSLNYLFGWFQCTPTCPWQSSLMAPILKRCLCRFIVTLRNIRNTAG